MARIIRRVRRFETVLDFDRQGLGRAMMLAAAEAVFEDMRAEQSPDGRRWPELSAMYAAWKSATHPGAPMAVLEGHMRTVPQLTGLAFITAREIVQVYGVDELARSLASWFQLGDRARNRPPRPFYVFGPLVVDRVMAVLTDHFHQAFT